MPSNPVNGPRSSKTARAQTESEGGLGRVADDLANLIGRLKNQDAGDGSMVVTPERWKRFFGDSI